MVRRGPRGRDRRRAHLLCGAGGQPDHPGEEQGLPRQQPRHQRPDGQGLLAQYHPLDVRHLRTCTHHRLRGGASWRRYLVFPDRRLRLRPGAGTRHYLGGDRLRRQGAGFGEASAQCHRLLLLPFAGAVLEGEGDRPGQRRRRHHQFDQGGERVRHRQGRAEARRSPGLRHRRAVADAAGGAGPGADRVVLLGSER